MKGSFCLPRSGEPLRLGEEQALLVMADTFTGEPGLSAPVYEADLRLGTAVRRLSGRQRLCARWPPVTSLVLPGCASAR